MLVWYFEARKTSLSILLVEALSRGGGGGTWQPDITEGVDPNHLPASLFTGEDDIWNPFSTTYLPSVLAGKSIQRAAFTHLRPFRGTLIIIQG